MPTCRISLTPRKDVTGSWPLTSGSPSGPMRRRMRRTRRLLECQGCAHPSLPSSSSAKRRRLTGSQHRRTLCPVIWLTTKLTEQGPQWPQTTGKTNCRELEQESLQEAPSSNKPRAQGGDPHFHRCHIVLSAVSTCNKKNSSTERNGEAWPRLRKEKTFNRSSPEEARGVDLPDEDVTPAVTEVQNAEGTYVEVISGIFTSECVEAIATLSGGNEIMNVLCALEKAELLRALRKLMWRL